MKYPKDNPKEEAAEKMSGKKDNSKEERAEKMQDKKKKK